MPYGTVKVDNVTFTNNSVDATTTFSGIYASITNNLTLSGTATAATFTGTTANFTNVNAQNISVTTSLSGLAITGGTAGFTTITGTTVTGTTANFATLSGTTVTGTTARFITITGGTAGFTTVTGTTVTGTTANFVTVSGTTVTGTTASFTSGIFTSLSGTTHTITSGVFALGTAALPSISFVSDPNTGIYSPGADQLAVATNGTQRLTVDTAATTSTLPVVHPLGAVGTPSITFTGDLNTGIYSPSADTLAFVEGGSEAMRIDSSGRLLVGTSSSLATKYQASSFQPGFQSAANVGTGGFFRYSADADGPAFVLSKSRDASVGSQTVLVNGDNVGYLGFAGSDGTAFQTAATIIGQVDGTPGTNDMPGRLVFSTTADGAATVTERMRITSGGFVGIGTTSVTNLLHLRSDSSSNVDHLYLQNRNAGANSGARIAFSNGNSDYGDNRYAYIGAINTGASENGNHLVFAPNGNGASATEKARIDSSGRLLVGTSTARSNFYNTTATSQFQIEGTAAEAASLAVINTASSASGARLHLAKGRGGSIGSNTIVVDGDVVGQITFQANDGTEFVESASIQAFVDGTPGANDMPGRLVFSTTADGAASPTEALRITNDRVIAYNQPTPTSKSAAATLTITELKTGIIQYTGAVDTLTLPTGTLMEGGFSGIYTNMAFQWSVINTGTGICTVAAGTDHTVIGSGTVAIGASARFVSRRTAANTFVSYRLS